MINDEFVTIVTESKERIKGYHFLQNGKETLLPSFANISEANVPCTDVLVQALFA